MTVMDDVTRGAVAAMAAEVGVDPAAACRLVDRLLDDGALTLPAGMVGLTPEAEARRALSRFAAVAAPCATCHGIVDHLAPGESCPGCGATRPATPVAP